MTDRWGGEITGVILVGGKSSRMGRDKAFLELDGQTLFDRVLGLFREQFERVILVGDRAERFAGYGLPVVPDRYPGSSLGGLYTGLETAPSPYVFAAACDLAFPSASVLDALCALRGGCDAAVARTRRGWEPLFALYAKSCLPAIREQLERGNCCAFAYYPHVNVKSLEESELSRLDPQGTAFVNLNTPHDLQAARR